MNKAVKSKWKPGGRLNVADAVFEFQNTTLINNWLHEVDERQEELPSPWTGRPVKRHFEFYLRGQFSNQLRAAQQRG